MYKLWGIYVIKLQDQQTQTLPGKITVSIGINTQMPWKSQKVSIQQEIENTKQDVENIKRFGTTKV